MSEVLIIIGVSLTVIVFSLLFAAAFVSIAIGIYPPLGDHIQEKVTSFKNLFNR